MTEQAHLVVVVPASHRAISTPRHGSWGGFGFYREGSPRWMFFGEGASLRLELLKHLHNEYYRFAREVAPTHFCLPD